MRKVFILFTFIYSPLVFSQSLQDSIITQINEAPTDTGKGVVLRRLYDEMIFKDPEQARQIVLYGLGMISQENEGTSLNVYHILADFLQSQSQYDSSIVIYQHILKLGEQHNAQMAISEALVGLSNSYWRKGNFKTALEFQKQNLKLVKKMEYAEGIARAYNNLGNIYKEIGEYTKAMEYYTLASKRYQKLDHLKNYAITLANIGMMHSELKNYKAAEQYLHESDSLFSIVEFKPGRAFVLKTLAIIYAENQQINQSIKYNLLALESYQELGSKHQIGQILNTLGNTYINLKNYATAIDYFNRGLALTQAIGDSSGMGFNYKSLGICYYQNNEWDKAIEMAQKAIAIGSLQGTPYTALAAHETLSKIYAAKKQFTKAYTHLTAYNLLKDSLYSQEKRELAADIEAKYQNEQKVKEIALLESENDIKALQLQQRINERNTIITFTIIILIILGLLFNQYRVKQKANKKLTELDRLKSNFFANISHEFRTPLTLIKGPIEQLRQSPDEGLSIENITMINRNTNRLLKLVNQLLELSKIDEGSLKLEPTEGDIFKCLRSVTASFNSHAAQRHIDFKVSIPNTLLWTSFDRDKLEKIAYNLLSNAFKFSDHGATITFEITYENQLLQILVSDTGKGIPSEKQPFIFDRFFQADTSTTREVDGSGIGLSLTKELVELMKGTITVSSEVNKGSFFTVQIPVLEIKIRPDQSQNGNSITSGEFYEEEKEATLPNHKPDAQLILIVEDNTDMQFYIRQKLDKEFNIQIASDGEEGWTKALEYSPDLIITDLMMPKMDGIELCKKVKTDVNTSHIPVIMLTAKAGTENKIEGLETGADDYLTKPFDSDELLVRTKNLIDQRKQLREKFSKEPLQIDPKKITITSLDKKFMEKILQLLEEKCADAEFGVPEMQESLAMSKAQLHRKTKALVNQAPGELLRNFRLKRAAQMIEQHADNITQIAYSVGFNNHSYFTKCFKDYFGVSPSAYLSRHEKA